MFARLALLFVAVPLLELYLLVRMGEWVGLLPTIALVVATGILGAALARLEGLRTLKRFRAALAAGRPPHRELVEGLLVLIAGAVLLTPGLLTDLTGFLLLVPPVRRAVAGRLVDRLAARVLHRSATVTGGPRRPDAGRSQSFRGSRDVVDVEFEVVEEENPR
jgi:UPF0716 protein FxsA